MCCIDTRLPLWYQGAVWGSFVGPCRTGLPLRLWGRLRIFFFSLTTASEPCALGSTALKAVKCVPPPVPPRNSTLCVSSSLKLAADCDVLRRVSSDYEFPLLLIFGVSSKSGVRFFVLRAWSVSSGAARGKFYFTEVVILFPTHPLPSSPSAPLKVQSVRHSEITLIPTTTDKKCF